MVNVRVATARGNPDEGSAATEPKVLVARVSLILAASLTLAYAIIGACTQRIKVYDVDGPSYLEDMAGGRITTCFS